MNILSTCILIFLGTMAVSAQSFTQTGLSAFAAVEAFLPYRGAVVASSDGSYSVIVNAPESNITNFVEAVVSSSGVLNLGLSSGIPTTNMTVSLYNYTISVPAGSLSSFSCGVSNSLNIDGTAANATAFTLNATAPYGSGKLAMADLSSQTLNINTVGFAGGHFMVAPTVQLMRYNCSGTGSANITGMTGSVRATFDKLYSLYLPQGSDSLSVEVVTSAPTKIYQTTGTCHVTGNGPAAVSATCVDATGPPPLASPPLPTAG